jgi:hypothetical protein
VTFFKFPNQSYMVKKLFVFSWTMDPVTLPFKLCFQDHFEMDFTEKSDYMMEFSHVTSYIL